MSGFSTFQNRSIWRKAWDRLVSKYNWRFREQHHVYDFDPDLPAPSSLDNFRIERFERVEDVGPNVLEGMLRNGGERSREEELAEIRQGGVYWLAFLESEIVGSAMSRRGKYFVRWLLPLQPEDQVIFRLRTLPAFRGRGIGSLLLRSIALGGTAPGEKAFVDCRDFNTPSIRTIEKAGFRRIATVKSLTREEAMGPAR